MTWWGDDREDRTTELEESEDHESGRDGHPGSRANRDEGAQDRDAASDRVLGRPHARASSDGPSFRAGSLPAHPPGPPPAPATANHWDAWDLGGNGGDTSTATDDDPDRRSPRRRRADSPPDPVQAAFGDTADLYEIATWEVRSDLDRFAVRLTNTLESTRRWLVISFAVALFVTQLFFAAVLVAETPVIGVLAFVSALPALVLAGYFWYGDPTTREPLLTLAVTFLLAVAFASIAGVVNSATVPIFEAFGLVGMALFYFLVVGPIEEFVKWLAIRVYAFRSDAFRTVVDGVVYGAMAGVGFAAIENLLYIIMVSVEMTPTGAFVQQGDAIAIATQRAFVGPGHVIFSAWAGFYLGLAKFNYGKRGPIVVKGLLIAAFIHGLYNTLVTTLPLTAVTFVAFIVVFHGFWFSLLYRKIHRYRELYRQRPEPEPAEA